MARTAPFLPLIGGGKTAFQPVYVGDIAEAVANLVDGKALPGRIYELGGPEVLTFRQCLEIMLAEIDRDTPFISLPFPIASLIGSIASLIPLLTPPITADQVKLLKSDNVVSKEAEAEGRTLAALGVTPTLVLDHPVLPRPLPSSGAVCPHRQGRLSLRFSSKPARPSSRRG